ncbi:MAG: AAC(3) family N-acetyltransferase [Lachnospirales bacterium]
MNKELFKQSLINAGIGYGDTILVHSNMGLIGRWTDIENDSNEICRRVKEIIFEVIGEDGTMCTPAYFYEYARKNQEFDIVRSSCSSELGIFAKYCLEDKSRERSINPITSICAIGKNAKFIVGGNTGYSYGYDTPWDRIMRLKGKLVFIGIDLRALTFAHHAEHSMCLPHLYNKLYTTKVYRDGVEIDTPICCHVRYLNYEIKYNSKKNTEIFQNAGLLKISPLERSNIYVLDANEAFEFCIENLKKDYYFLLENPPIFKEGQIPMV